MGLQAEEAVGVVGCLFLDELCAGERISMERNKGERWLGRREAYCASVRSGMPSVMSMRRTSVVGPCDRVSCHVWIKRRVLPDNVYNFQQRLCFLFLAA